MNSILLAAFSLVYASDESYAPVNVQCPKHSIARSAHNDISSEEQQWLSKRDEISQPALMNWLADSNLTDYDFVIDKPVRIGLAFSGGGFRAMLTGAGMLAAIDNRVEGSGSENGGLGGLLQASTYIAGLSGGAWLIGSIAGNNWSSVAELQTSPHVWNFQNPFQPTHSRSDPLDVRYDLSVLQDVGQKANKNFPVTFTDLWGRFLSAQLFGQDTNHARHRLWSSLLSEPGVNTHTMPLPILVSDGTYTGGNQSLKMSEFDAIKDGENLLPLNSTVYEITPFEFGSWDAEVSQFINIMYLGTKLTNGKPQNSEICVNGYDNIGFLLGTSSTIFNEIVDGLVSGPLQPLLQKYEPDIISLGSEVDIALIGPNPFQGITEITDLSRLQNLPMVDGGENGENIPFRPMLQPSREVDIIFALDSSADTSSYWPNGTSLLQTSKRQSMSNYTRFPHFDISDIESHGIASQPMFLGCNWNSSLPPEPLIVYIPNSNQTFMSNQSTFKLKYADHERNDMIRNGFNVMTRNNGTDDDEWRSCVACAILLRAQEREDVTPTQQCQACFVKYCYDSPEATDQSGEQWDPETGPFLQSTRDNS